ncbi:MAG: RtcB family protein [Myxococcota bacterium]
MSLEAGDAALARITCWVPGPLDGEVERALARLAASEDVVHVAAMPDVHLADGVCVGCVTATRSALYPDAVGGDIGCGMAALAFDAEVPALGREDAARLLWHLGRVIPVLQHASAGARLPELGPLSAPALAKAAATVGRVQFATLGRGNHFVELQRDESDRLWLMLHSGSRGIGQAIRDHHRARARALPSGLACLAAEAPAGADYLADLGWALAYARLARRAMVERAAEGVAAVLGAEPDWASYRDCHHNDVRRERHGDEALWVHRKGAIHAGLDVPGIIPGSMGSASHHVSGRGEPTSLCSSSHGAGRAMSRGEARRHISLAAFERQVGGVWFDRRLSDRLRDEAPGAYKDIGRVMRAQRELTRIERTLWPLLSYKGA